MQIGSLTFTSSIIQAPLAGYSCAPMRVLVQRFGGAAFCETEMLSAKHIAAGARQKPRYQYKSPDEGRLCYQLSGSEADHLCYALERVQAWGADLVDLNCGCPMPKIRKKHCGSQLLAEPERLYRVVRAMRANTDLPLLVKVRVDGRSGEQNNAAVAEAVEKAGADALTVHGRHWTERYDTPCHYADIAAMKRQVRIPVIGNGDIADLSSAQRMLEQTGCDGLMIARAAVGQPWLFQQIQSGLRGETFTPPTLVERGALFLEHMQGLMALEGEKLALLQGRKLAKYYLREQASAQKLEAFYRLNDWQDLPAWVARHFSDDAAYFSG